MNSVRMRHPRLRRAHRTRCAYRRTARSPRITVTYEYDALHRRIQRLYDDPGIGSPIVGEGTDYYFTTKWQVIEERVGSDVTQQHVWSERYVNAPVLRDRDTDTDGLVDERVYFQYDANFNVTALIADPEDKGWQVVERVVYDSYGAPTFLDANWSSPLNYSPYWNEYLFQGGRRDVNTGLVNFQMRDLSTGLGRWVQVDPAGYVDGMNLYQFVVSNPVNRVDPFGLQAVPPAGTPTPPGWGPGWEWGPPTGEGPGAWRWFDPSGGEWRHHPVDKWHPKSHWDHNPWEKWNSPWRNVPAEGSGTTGAAGAGAGGSAGLQVASGATVLLVAGLAIVGSAHALDTDTMMQDEYERAMNQFRKPNPLWAKLKKDREEAERQAPSDDGTVWA